MILLQLYFEFFKTGLFAVGGGLATIPFLQEMGQRTNWFTDTDLTTMMAVSESTPGPIGINMATYVGFETAGIPGAVLATLGLVTPSLCITLIIAGFLQKFRTSRTVDAVFQGLRPASTALVACAGLSVAASVLLEVGGTAEHFSIHWLSLFLAVGIFLAMKIPALKKLHPITFIALSALLGMIFQL